MASPPGHVNQALKNEKLAEELKENYQEFPEWVVTCLFYSAVHFVQCKLIEEGKSPGTHGERKRNIKDTTNFSNRVYSLYRSLEDDSQDARYECVDITPGKMVESEDDLYFMKSELGFV